MPAAWRIVKSRYARTAFDGEGSRLYGGRWTPVGVPAVYLSSTLALATLELLVHLGDVRPLSAYVTFELAVPDELVSGVDIASLPQGWIDYPAPASLQQIGEEWARSRRTVTLRVPSAIVPVEHNFVLNPEHPDMARVTIGDPRPFDMDPRLLKLAK